MPISLGRGGGGGGGGGGLLFRSPADVFTGADVAACRTARNAYFDSSTNLSALDQFQADQFLALVLNPASSTDNIFETYLPGNSGGLRLEGQEFALDAANVGARGMTTSATYAYVVDDPTEQVYVYRLSDGARQTGQEFDIHSTNSWPVGIGVDATNAYVADRTQTKTFVYQLSDGARQTGQEVDFHSDNAQPAGIAVDATYAYVVDGITNHVYVYALSGGARQTGQEFDLHSENENPQGVAVDATNAYVADRLDRKVYIYRLSDGARQTGQEFGLHSGNTDSRGIGVTSGYAYVADLTDLRVYVYRRSGFYDSTQWLERTGFAQGNPGTAGADSTVVGPTGPAGADGARGATGAQGADSTVVGPTGPAGAGGARGVTGATGADSTVVGPTGPAGAVGVMGATGATGADSTVVGPMGPAGADGATGVMGAMGTMGATGAQGADSTVVGPMGPAGADGAMGAMGAQGLAGGSTLRTGAGVPDASLGADDDWYLRTSNGAMYQKGSGSWSVVYTDQVGQAGSGITESAANSLIQTALSEAVTMNTETGIAVTYNSDGTIDFVIQAPAQTHTNWVGIIDGALSAVTASDFTVSGVAEALTIPAYSGTRRLLFARPASESDPSEVYLYQSGHRNTVNQIHVFVKSASVVQLGGEAHNWWGTADLQNGAGGYVLEQVN